MVEIIEFNFTVTMFFISHPGCLIPAMDMSGRKTGKISLNPYLCFCTQRISPVKG